jgi:hypothetical protein
VGQAIFFTGVAPTGTTYSWSGPIGFASTVQSPARTNAQLSHSGVYTMNATVPGCGLLSRTTTVSVVTCRQSEPKDVKDLTVEGVTEGSIDAQVSGGTTQESGVYGKLTAWPNPNSGDVVMLKWEGLSGEDRSITVRIFDATGREVMLKSVSYDLSGSAGDEIVFPSRLAKGLYTIETVHDDRYVYTKLMIE